MGRSAHKDKGIWAPDGYRIVAPDEMIPKDALRFRRRDRTWQPDLGGCATGSYQRDMDYPHAVPITEAPKKPKAPVVQETSREALKSQKDKAPTDCGAILARLKRGRTGLTCDELETLLSMSHQTASARLRDLAMRGDILDSGKRRKTRTGRTAIVWQVATA